MMKLCLILAVTLISSGCAVNTVYDPVKAANNQVLLLNEALNQVKVGMTQAEIHTLMGEKLIVGYSYQNPLPGEASPLAVASERSAEPITIPNPYKSEPHHPSRPDCMMEYYVTSIHHPDGVISDEELMPLLFCKGVLKAKGWDRIK